ncbi:MAG: glycosyltransferase [Caldilineaceae bacterium]
MLQNSQRWFKHFRGFLTATAWCLAVLYALDRGLKLLAVHRFLRSPQPPAPSAWPSVTLLQPITRGASDLPTALARRAALTYQGHLQHVLICDAGDDTAIPVCRSWLAAHPELDAQMLTLDPGTAPHNSAHPDPAKRPQSPPSQERFPTASQITTKVEKLRTALPHATGEILAFVDDDILLRPDAIDLLVRHLQDRHAGAVFGLAVYTNWSNIPSSLLSAFVNANALLSYLPLTYLVDPYTITGHFYALRREVFAAIGGLDGMDGRFDDDHELARRVEHYELKNVQTPIVYDVDNYLATFNGYTNQMRRWFVIPRQTMAPYLTPYHQFVSLIGSVGNLIPPLLAALTLLGGIILAPFAITLTLYAAIYAWCEHAYLARTTPLNRWPWVLLSALIAPLQAMGAFLGSSEFYWRGQRIRLHPGGRYDILPEVGGFREEGADRGWSLPGRVPLPGRQDGTGADQP